MFRYYRLIGFCFLCLVSTSVCDICSTCSCSTTSTNNHVSPVVNEGPIINCHGKRLGTDDMLNFDLLMLDDRQASNTLILSKNNIVNLSGPLLKKLKLLKSLDLSENLMKEIHTLIFIDLNNLEDLNLSKNLLATFDDSLLEVLPALLALNLSHNQISVIEHRISKSATKINFLDLSHNNVTSLPNMFFESLSNLQYLDLSFNKIHTFQDDSFMRLNSLKTVYIHNNLLTSLRMQIFPKSLNELHSGYNSIAEVFYEPSLIKVLNIEHNRISEIHSNVTALEYLERLNVSGNAISNFPNILLENLKTLDVSYNKLPNIPETISIKNFPLLVHLNVSKNPIQNLTLRSDLMLHTFVASNISMLETIGKDTFAKLRAPSKDCINLTVSNNRRLSSVHEEALERMNLCSLDLSNNLITYMSKKVILRNASSVTYSVNLQGNPFKCNCSLQWMLSDLMPQLYTRNPGLLNNLRCAWPPQISNMRMVHWYGWKEQIFCMNTSDFMEELTMKVAGVSNDRVTLDSSPAAIIILGAAVGVLTILIIVGFIWTQKVSMRKRRMNRKF